MVRLTLIVMLWAFGASVATGIEVRFEQPIPLEAKQIRSRAVTMADAGQTADSIAAGISVQLSELGYLDAKAVASRDTVNVSAGPKYLIGSVIVTGSRDGDSILVRPHGVSFTPRGVESVTDGILDDWFELGYYYARLTLTSTRKSEAAVHLEYRLQLGPVLTLEQVSYDGLRYTRPALIDRYLSADSGDTITDVWLARLEQSARRVPFVRFRPPATIVPRPGFLGADVRLAFGEPDRVSVEGGGGYIPDDPTGVVWNFNVRLRNLFGGGRNIDVQSERRETGRQVLGIDYRQPAFLFGAGEAGARVATRDYRDDFYEFALEGDVETAIDDDFDLGGSLGWRRVEPSGEEPGYSAYSAVARLMHDRTDDPLLPREGYRSEWAVGYTNRRFSEDTAGVRRPGVNEARVDLALDWYLQLVGRLAGHAHLAWRSLETSDSLPPTAELYFVGGPGSLRGYRNEQFVVQRTAQVSVEPAWTFGQGSFLVFYDGAYLNYPVKTPGGVKSEEDYRQGYGLGVVLRDRNRAVSLSFGWNPESPFNQPRLSVSFRSDL